jgi:hypothetical protein
MTKNTYTYTMQETEVQRFIHIYKNGEHLESRTYPRSYLDFSELKEEALEWIEELEEADAAEEMINPEDLLEICDCTDGYSYTDEHCHDCNGTGYKAP